MAIAGGRPPAKHPPRGRSMPAVPVVPVMPVLPATVVTRRSTETSFPRLRPRALRTGLGSETDGRAATAAATLARSAVIRSTRAAEGGTSGSVKDAPWAFDSMSLFSAAVYSSRCAAGSNGRTTARTSCLASPVATSVAPKRSGAPAHWASPCEPYAHLPVDKPTMVDARLRRRRIRWHVGRAPCRVRHGDLGRRRRPAAWHEPGVRPGAHRRGVAARHRCGGVSIAPGNISYPFESDALRSGPAVTLVEADA